MERNIRSYDFIGDNHVIHNRRKFPQIFYSCCGGSTSNMSAVLHWQILQEPRKDKSNIDSREGKGKGKRKGQGKGKGKDKGQLKGQGKGPGMGKDKGQV